MNTPRFKAWHRESKEFCEGTTSNMFQWVEDGQPVELLQYIGIKDKYGKEACVGDICMNEEGRVAKVIYFEAGACFDFVALNSIGNSFGFTPQQFPRHIKIIGNTYENPELRREQ